MRRVGERVVQVALTPAEYDAVQTLRVAGEYSSVSNLVRDALWSLADEAGMSLPPGVFDRRAQGSVGRWGWHAVGRVDAARRHLPKLPRPHRSGARPQQDDHPWRRTWRPREDTSHE